LARREYQSISWGWSVGNGYTGMKLPDFAVLCFASRDFTLLLTLELRVFAAFFCRAFGY
jgi:hypothetical protein